MLQSPRRPDGIAEFAAFGTLVATKEGVPCRIRPFYVREFAHAYDTPASVKTVRLLN